MINDVIFLKLRTMRPSPSLELSMPTVVSQTGPRGYRIPGVYHFIPRSLVKSDWYAPLKEDQFLGEKDL